MKLFRGFILGLLIVGLMACQRRGVPPKTTAIAAPRLDPSYVELAPGMQNLKSDFNAHLGDVRLVYIVGATCPECLHGMSVLGKALSASKDSPRLRTYIVYVPALGAKAKDIPPTVSLIPGTHVRRYWDPHGTAGYKFENTLAIGQFAWDVYMIYDQDQTWNGGTPPKPRFWMDQLGGLSHQHFLNADVFAEHVRHALASGQPGTAKGP